MNVLSKIRQTGWKYSVAIVFNRIVPEWLFRMRRYVVYEVATPNSRALEPRPTISIQRSELEREIVAVEELTYFQRSYSTGQSIAYSAKVDDQLAAGMWASTKVFDENELGVRVLLTEDQVWLFAAFVSSDFRGQGIYAMLLPFTMRDLATRGLNNQLVAVNPDNLASNHIHQKRSNRKVGSVLAIRFLKVTGCWTWGDIDKDRTISWNAFANPICLKIN